MRRWPPQQQDMETQVQGHHEAGNQGDGGPFGISEISRMSQMSLWGRGAGSRLGEGSTLELRAH